MSGLQKFSKKKLGGRNTNYIGFLEEKVKKETLEVEN